MKRLNKRSFVKSSLGMGTVEVISKYLYVDIVRGDKCSYFSRYMVFTHSVFEVCKYVDMSTTVNSSIQCSPLLRSVYIYTSLYICFSLH